ncbi:MAG: YdcF family protein [Candidatus Kaiserbacteria bacterium]|nr:YdcF family protein [Candidatus Kaiserbacteria bacterium]
MMSSSGWCGHCKHNTELPEQDMNEIDRNTLLIWNYMKLDQEVRPGDVIVVLGSIDLRVAERAVDLYEQKFAPLIVCSGNRGRGTASFQETEARMLAERLVSCGVPTSKILIEEQATNTGENATRTRALLHERSIPVQKAIIVTKPYMERRAYATFSKQWPEIKTYITSPQIAYEDYFLDEKFKHETISHMVGDLERIRRYGSEGFQIPQEIPEEVWEAYENLIKLGYGKYVPAL